MMNRRVFSRANPLAGFFACLLAITLLATLAAPLTGKLLPSDPLQVLMMLGFFALVNPLNWLFVFLLHHFLDAATYRVEIVPMPEGGSALIEHWWGLLGEKHKSQRFSPDQIRAMMVVRPSNQYRGRIRYQYNLALPNEKPILRISTKQESVCQEILEALNAA